MTKKIFPLVLCALLATPAYAAHPQCGKTELASTMGHMKDAMKAYKKAFKSGDDAKMNTVANELLKQVRQADAFIPLTINDSLQLNSDQQGKFDQYRQGMSVLEKAVVKLTQADDKNSRKAALALISKASKKGHKAFKMDCDD